MKALRDLATSEVVTKIQNRFDENEDIIENAQEALEDRFAAMGNRLTNLDEVVRAVILDTEEHLFATLHSIEESLHRRLDNVRDSMEARLDRWIPKLYY